ncbi:MAG: ATP-binding protein [Nanoarchaeota archaeon]
MELEKLAEQNPWWKGKEFVEKDYDLIKWKAKKCAWVPGFIEKIKFEPFSLHVLLGPRQVGKTTALKLLIKKLLEKKEPQSFFYFNCEDVADYKELEIIIKNYLELKAGWGIKHSVIILDEVTSPKEWYRAIKLLIDKGDLRDEVVILSGSSSIAIKRQTELFPGRRGRGRDFTLFPLSFREFIKITQPQIYKKIEPITNFAELKEKSAKAMLHFKELDQELKKYFSVGGFPLGIEAMDNNKEEAKRTYLNWIKTTILKNGRNDLIARQILKSVIEKMPSPMSWEGLSKEIEIKSPKTVSAYLDLLQAMFVLIILHNLDLSSKKIKFGKNKKIHLLDPLLLEILEDWCFISRKERESLLAESLVAVHLQRFYPERVFFWRGNFEYDCLVMENNKLHGFEVKWSEEPEAKKLPQLKELAVITKKDFSLKFNQIPLAVFLAVLAV